MRYAVLVGYMALLCFMSLVPLHKVGEPVPLLQQLFDNAMHIPAYALLTYLLIRCFKSISTRALLISALVALGYGLLMEYFQSLTPNRYLSFMDVCLNGIGIVLVLFVFKKAR